MATATCINCKWFQADNELGTGGFCKRYPATICWSEAEQAPITADVFIDAPATEYCGEFKALAIVELPVFQTKRVIPIQPLQSAEDGEELNVS